MKSIDLKNTDVLKTLNQIKDCWVDEKDILEKYYRLLCPDADRDEYISEDYRKKIMNMGSAHDGFPEKLKGYGLKLESNDDSYLHKEGAGGLHIAENISKHDKTLQTLLSTRTNALNAVYPPGGFISWHNNANASAYNIILTWSETGNGWWKHVDPYTNEIVTVPDKPGWQAKAFYFGSYEDSPQDIVYHAASTDCWRMTISYVFDRHHKDYWEDIIEELEYAD